MQVSTIRRPTLYGLWSFQFLTMMRRGVFYSFMYIYLFSLLGNVTTTATLGTFTMLLSAAGQNLLWGKISDRYRLRAQLVVIGEVVAGFAYIIVFFVHRYFIEAGNDFTAGLALVTGLSILEFFWSMSDVGWAALVTDITTPETRGGFVGAINFVMSIGRMTGILIAGYLYLDGLGFRQGTIFYVVSTMLVAGAVVMWLVSRAVKPREIPTFLDTAKKEGRNSVDEFQSSPTTGSGNEFAFVWYLAALTIIVLGAASVNQIFPLFLKLNAGLAATDLEVSFILSAWTVGGMTASLVAGRLADRLGRATVIVAGLILAAATPLFYGVAPTVMTMAVVYGINGVAFMTLQTAGFALAGDIIPPPRRGRLLSRYNAVMALTWGPAGLLIGGPIADIQTRVLGASARTAYINAFVVSSVLIACGTLVFVAKVKGRAAKDRLSP